MCPDNEELRIEDLNWAVDLLNREKSGNREWKPIHEHDPTDSDSDFELLTEIEQQRLENPHN